MSEKYETVADIIAERDALKAAGRFMLAAFNVPDDGSADSTLELHFRKPVKQLREALAAINQPDGE